MNSSLNVRVIREKELHYRGPELRPHFLLEHFGMKGSVLAAFRGPCRVQTDHLVDWEDRLANDRIEAKDMVHFLGEWFGITLREGVFAQRLFMASLAESLRSTAPGAREIRRDGDDLFVGDRKLTVSIVTASPVSVLLHAGVNIDPHGAPVAAIGLSELGIAEPMDWAESVMHRFREEWEGISWACTKVRPVV